VVTQIPLLVHVPWLPPGRSAALVEAVDIYPSLVELAGIADAVHDLDELEGTSFVPLLSAPDRAWKTAAFSVYPRCFDASGVHIDSSNQCTTTNSSDFAAMGESIRTASFRYTRWMRWNGTKLESEWDHVIGEELYGHRDTGSKNHQSRRSAADGAHREGREFRSPVDHNIGENENLAGMPGYEQVQQELIAALQLGPKGALPPSS
jgi:hypothetical protein